MEKAGHKDHLGISTHPFSLMSSTWGASCILKPNTRHSTAIFYGAFGLVLGSGYLGISLLSSSYSCVGRSACLGSATWIHDNEHIHSCPDACGVYPRDKVSIKLTAPTSAATCKKEDKRSPRPPYPSTGYDPRHRLTTLDCRQGEYINSFWKRAGRGDVFDQFYRVLRRS